MRARGGGRQREGGDGGQRDLDRFGRGVFGRGADVAAAEAEAAGEDWGRIWVGGGARFGFGLETVELRPFALQDPATAAGAAAAACGTGSLLRLTAVSGRDVTT